MMDKNTIIVSILVSIIGIILMLSWKNKKSKYENNKQCIIGKEKKVEGLLFGGCFDIWHVSHFILWFIVGIFAPGYYIQVALISIIWELTENYCFKKNKKCNSVFCGRVEDIFTNIIAYSIGSYFKNNGFFININ